MQSIGSPKYVDAVTNREKTKISTTVTLVVNEKTMLLILGLSDPTHSLTGSNRAVTEDIFLCFRSSDQKFSLSGNIQNTKNYIFFDLVKAVALTHVDLFLIILSGFINYLCRVLPLIEIKHQSMTLNLTNISHKNISRLINKTLRPGRATQAIWPYQFKPQRYESIAQYCIS